MYYSAEQAGYGGRQCIGAAIATDGAGSTFVPQPSPKLPVILNKAEPLIPLASLTKTEAVRVAYGWDVVSILICPQYGYYGRSTAIVLVTEENATTR